MDGQVLVLNANYQPVNICNLRRAVGLLMADRADLVLNGRGVLRLMRGTFPRPSVIRLLQMVSVPRIHARLSRREVFRRDGYVCQYCGKHTPELTIDHVIPRHMGGRHIWTNVVAACPACNHRKGGRTSEEAHMFPMNIPQEPSTAAVYVFGHYLVNNADWEPFIAGW